MKNSSFHDGKNSGIYFYDGYNQSANNITVDYGVFWMANLSSSYGINFFYSTLGLNWSGTCSVRIPFTTFSVPSPPATISRSHPASASSRARVVAWPRAAVRAIRSRAGPCSVLVANQGVDGIMDLGIVCRRSHRRGYPAWAALWAPLAPKP